MVFYPLQLIRMYFSFTQRLINRISDFGLIAILQYKTVSSNTCSVINELCARSERQESKESATEHIKQILKSVFKANKRTNENITKVR